MDTRAISERVSAWLRPFKQGFAKDYTVLPDIWLLDEDEFIDRVSHTEPEDCLELMRLSEDSFSKIAGVEDASHNNISIEPPGDNLILWYSQPLLDLAKEDKWEKNIENIPRCGQAMLFFGYRCIYLVAIMRFYCYLKAYGTRDQLYVKFADLINIDPRNKTVVDESRQNLNRFALNIYDKPKKLKGDQITRDPNQIESFVGQALLKAFNKFPSAYHQMMAAAKGNKDIQYVPKRAATRFTREQFKEEKYQYAVSSMDAPIQVKGNEGSDLTRNDTMSNPNALNQQELLELRENRLINSDQIDIIWKLLKDPEHFTDRQRQVYTMRNFAPGKRALGEDEQPTFKDIGLELGISKQRANEICKRTEDMIKQYLDNLPE